jgi:hypothetical protein
MSINASELEFIINKSRLLNNDQYYEEELEEIIVLMEEESKLNRKDIFDLIINEDAKFIFSDFGVVWTFIDKYDFDNIDILKQKYKDYAKWQKQEIQNKADNEKQEIQNKADNEKQEIQNKADNEKQEIQNKADNEKQEIQNKADNDRGEINKKLNELNGNIFLRFINAEWEDDKIKFIIKKNMIDEVKLTNEKINELFDIVELKFEPENNDEIKGLPLAQLDW